MRRRTGFSLGAALVVLAFSAVCFFACRGGRRVPIALGFLFATKQYAFLVGATAFFLDGDKFSWRRAAKTLAVAAAVAFATVLPFLIWDFRGFWWSVIEARKLQQGA